MELSSFAGFGDDSDEARAVAEAYPVALKQCLEFADWSFASELQTLPMAVLPVAGGADPDLPWFFHLPEGCVRIHELGDADGTVAWRRDGIGLRSDTAGPLRIRFTGTPTNEAMLSGMFQTAVALHVAALLGPRYMGGVATRLDRLEAMKLRQLQLAAHQDGRQASAARYDGLGEQGDWAHEAGW